jgi:hypothetical protein
MANLVIRFVNSKGFVSSAIDWVEGGAGEYDHTECLDVATNEWIGAHDDGGFERRPFDYTTPSRERRYSIPCTQEEYDRGMTWLNAQIGVPYNFMDILGILLHKNLSTSGKLICSQAMFTYIFQALGRLPLNVLPENAHRVTPETLHLSPLLIGHCTYSSVV